ncbi:hypothetical protein QR680_000682 [Steinernema hermaphroditum]|uniref:RanBP2-type domain-containing protein n=1 Tax=Steinernema hermaphroditum TaxID=289476 RepID=A0AA39GVH4_9BILA|nr:hypothetical protein QR680_000682 [Steinernema hermaphroditum]
MLQNNRRDFFLHTIGVCMECNNVNWARRKTCNVCKAQRFACCEARTGYGGGYMNRQDVEYMPRNAHDEFGRKKKGIKRSSGVMESEYSDGEDEFDRKAHKYEEEHESGDDDLGKYDFESDNEFESLKMSLTKKVAEANNASRASSPCSCSHSVALEVVLTVVGITSRNAVEFATIMTVTIEAHVIVLTSGTLATTIDMIVIFISGIALVLNLHPVVAIVDSRSRKTPLVRHLVPNVGVLTRSPNALGEFSLLRRLPFLCRGKGCHDRQYLYISHHLSCPILFLVRDFT